MGVLGDDDIEKLNESFKKRKIPKLFHEPKRAYNAFYVMMLIGVYGIVILGATTFVLWSWNEIDAQEILDLTVWNTELSHRTDILINLIIDNADCPSLITMYNDDKLDQLELHKKVIKDEIAFRC